MGETTSPLITLENSTHHKVLVEGLSNYFNIQHAVDFDLLDGEDGGDRLRAHKLILQIFLSTVKLRTHNAHQAPSLTNTQILHTVLEFLYRGRVTVSEENLPKLLDYARQVDFRLLSETVESVIKEKRDSVSDNTMLVSRTDDQILQLNDTDFRSPTTTSTQQDPATESSQGSTTTMPAVRNGRRWKVHVVEPKDKIMSQTIKLEPLDLEEECTPALLVSTSMEPEHAYSSQTTYLNSPSSNPPSNPDCWQAALDPPANAINNSNLSNISPECHDAAITSSKSKMEVVDHDVKVPAEIQKNDDYALRVTQEHAACAAVQQGPLEFIKSVYGNPLLAVSGFLFSKERVMGAKTFWRCVENNAFKCPGRCHTLGDILVKFSTNHNHVPDVGKIGARRVLHEVKERALSTGGAIQELLDDVTAGADPIYTAHLPEAKLMRRSLQRARKREVPNLAATLRELTLPNSLKETLTGEPFLLFDSGADDDRILLFATATNMRLLSSSDTWYCDGTFRSDPPLFKHLYTVHAVSSPGVVVPCVFALLPSRTQNTYVRLFSALNQLQDGMRPTSLLTGFDETSNRALRQVYPGVGVRGCYFHLGQCVWRKLREIEGMEVRYSAEPDFALQVRLLAALAYVPVANVVAAFEALKVTPYYNRERRSLQPLLDFFEDTFVGRSDIRSAPVHALDMWNSYEWLQQGSPQTSNAVDAWHRGFDNRVRASSGLLNMWEFLSNLKQEQSANQSRIDQLVTGDELEGRRKYRDASKQLVKLVEEYGQRGLMDYLTTIAQNISLSV